jgi:DnaJ-class molecular chaperone
MSHNDITGDNLTSRPNSKAFDENFDKIFGKKKPRTCELCNGEGHYEVGLYDEHGHAFMQDTGCFSCGGTGEVHE